MDLIAGVRFGSYEIVAPIGRGGMGEVYRARDRKLDRDVAIKILPGTVAADPDRIARFEREARLLAALNHPNIAQIHGFEEADGIRALVMELVEGPTLADRLASGPIPLDEALAVARQIAEALETAHEQGIVHRDLKPANVKVRPDGTVKVLDFGLAKAIEPAGVATGSFSTSPTITSPAMTQAGIILGTAAYMSPEQARGKPIDKRADIWAFGCLLFEMLTGRRAFDAEDVSLTLAEVMKSEPSWALLPVLSPGVRMCLRRCLRKDPRQRLRDIGEARLALEGAVELETTVEPSVGAPPAPRRLWPWVLPFAAGSALAAAAVSLWLERALAPLPNVVRFEIHAPAGSKIPPGTPAISPDGRTLAYTMTAPDGTTRLHLRDLGSTETRPLAGTEGALHPFWSTDGRFLAFSSGFVLKRLDIADGSVRELARVVGPWHGSLNQFGDLLFTGDGLSRMPAEGGAPTPAVRLDANAGERGAAFPAFLTDGKRFVFRIGGNNAAGALHLASLDSPARRLILDDVFSGALVAPTPRGATYLFYVTDGQLVAREFDENAGQVRGAPRLIVNGIGTVASPIVIPTAGVSAAGILAYQTGGDFASGVLYWVGRSGERFGSIELAGSNPRLSPDGRSIAAGERTRGEMDVWLTDIDRGIASRLTRGGAAGAVWSPDSRRLAFAQSGRIYVKNADGSADETVLGDVFGLPTSWSSDGKNLLFQTPSGKIFLWPLPSVSAPIPVGSRNGRSRDGQLSPDSRHIAYVADETGRDEIYVQPLPPATGRIQVSGGGGTTPRWSHSGHELFFVSRDLAMMAIDVRFEPTLSASVPKKLFQFGPTSGAFGYDVGLDDQRFLVERRRVEATDAPITVVLNWWVPLAQRPH
ncbi:MAG TPA: protein kinase [Vicinamibacterales bacterium]|nr:protein kinase [Vicinamibacterales bacterium]